jgi:signal transduction histidine kinase
MRLLDERPVHPQPALHQLQDLVDVAVQQVPSPRIGDIRVRRLTRTAPTISADPDAVVQIVTNLLSNATKYSTPGTQIDVEIDCVKDRAQLIIRDRGIGFAPELTEAIFDGHRDPRACEMADGHGIGLRLSRRLAQHAGGRLWATSVPGCGASFHLELPLAEFDAPSNPAPSPLSQFRLPARWSDGHSE